VTLEEELTALTLRAMFVGLHGASPWPLWLDYVLSGAPSDDRLRSHIAGLKARMEHKL